MRGGCWPPCSFELNRARRSSRMGTAKGRDTAASCAARDAPRWSDARRLWAAVQLGAKPGATFCLNLARRSSRSGMAKGRDAAASCAARDAPRWSDARRLWAAVQL